MPVVLSSGWPEPGSASPHSGPRGTAAGEYLFLYGRHGWGPPETAFLLNFLLLGVPCAILLTGALSQGLGDRFATIFERLERVSARRSRLAAGVAFW
jgi:hypothetical protein